MVEIPGVLVVLVYREPHENGLYIAYSAEHTGYSKTKVGVLEQLARLIRDDEERKAR